MLFKELVYALRQLRKSPGYALLAIFTLALGIGASTAVFTVVDSVLLKALPYSDSGRLVMAFERVKFLGPTFPFVGPNPRHEDLWEKRSTAFTQLTIFETRATGVSLGAGHPQITGTINAYPNFLSVLAVNPLLGRAFRASDGVKGRDNVVMLTYNLWQTLFGGDPNAIGKTVTVNGAPLQVIGVLPPSFRFPRQTTMDAPEIGLLRPLVKDLEKWNWNGEYGDFYALGRLKPGVTVRQAEAQLNTIENQIVQIIPPAERDDEPNALRAYVVTMQEAVTDKSRTALWVLLAAVLGLLLVACVNLANAQLSRALSRQNETAVRSALGASKQQLLSSALAESLLLTVAGGLGGIGLAFAAVRLFVAFRPVSLPLMGDIRINAGVLIFATLLVSAAALLFGLLPALQMLRSDPQDALRQNNTRSQGSRRGRASRQVLIGFQIFACTVLLLLTGLFAKSLYTLLHTARGFDTSHIVAAQVNLSAKGYDKDETRTALDDLLLTKLRGLPGVQSASMVSHMPLAGESWLDGVFRTDRPVTQNAPVANVRWISSDYFKTIHEPLVAGRFFDERDRTLASVIISETTARAVWPHENPLGQQIQKEGKKYTVVGIVADARNNSLKLKPTNMLYFDYHDNTPYSSVFLVRGRETADVLAGLVRQAVWDQVPNIEIDHVKTLDSELAESIAPERFQTAVLFSFAGVGLLLAASGIYGVLSYVVAGRQREIGVRMALGATRANIYRLAVGEATLPVVIGLMTGWIASVLLARLVESLLFGAKTVGPEITLSVVTTFLVAAAAAAFLPARRAASVDPMQSLRAE